MAPSEIYEVRRDGFTISTERARLDRDAVYRYLSGESYWASGLARGIFERAVDGSLPFGLYAEDGAQIGYARVVSDGAVFAWLSDVYVLAAHRGKRARDLPRVRLRSRRSCDPHAAHRSRGA